MQRLSLGSPAARPRAAQEAEEAEADEKAAKAAAVAVRAPAPDKSIHLIPVLTLLCFLVLFLLSRDPSPALTDSPVLAAAVTVAATARSLEATAEATASVAGRVGGGVYRRLKQERAAVQQGRGRGRRLGAAQRGRG
ncbi:hypothetical protein ACP70R_019695 [Stipagrostis hirtigluma subsp. patula]